MQIFRRNPKALLLYICFVRYTLVLLNFEIQVTVSAELNARRFQVQHKDHGLGKCQGGSLDPHTRFWGGNDLKTQMPQKDLVVCFGFGKKTCTLVFQFHQCWSQNPGPKHWHTHKKNKTLRFYNGYTGQHARPDAWANTLTHTQLLERLCGHESITPPQAISQEIFGVQV